MANSEKSTQTDISSPLARYQHAVTTGELEFDPVQERTMKLLERAYGKLLCSSSRDPSLWQRLRARWGGGSSPVENVRGFYLWGGVGRGKTHLLNLFYDALPFPAKERVHFHRFMQRIHGELKALNALEDPLRIVARQLSSEFRVLCLDEFHVSDIADAMILSRLLSGLFDNGVTLVTTSNVSPSDLYRDGLQRARFLPAIELLEQYTQVVHVDGVLDYRLRTLEKSDIYLSPLKAEAQAKLTALFTDLMPENSRSNGVVTIQHRDIAYRHMADGIAWFTFEDLCGGPRSTADYIEIARYFHTVFLSDIPVIRKAENDRAIRFISLVDEFYDRNVNLIISAACPPAALYGEGRHLFAYERTVSRLFEMRSRDYLARKHLP